MIYRGHHLSVFRLTDALRTPSPLPPAPVFDVVPVSALTSRGSRFRCEPYRAILTAGTCADRQAARERNRGNGTTRAQYESCSGCTLGAQVAARVKPSPEAHGRAALVHSAAEWARRNGGERGPLCACGEPTGGADLCLSCDARRVSTLARKTTATCACGEPTGGALRCLPCDLRRMAASGGAL